VVGKYLLLGTNLGDRQNNLTKSIKLLRDSGILVVRLSGKYESEPWGIASQPWFLNQVIEISTALSPMALLDLCLEVEMKMGRVRNVKWGERLIDIDLLYYENETMTIEKLNLPHPEIANRRFALMPLCEIAGTEIDPISNKSIRQLLNECTDALICQKINTP